MPLLRYCWICWAVTCSDMGDLLSFRSSTAESGRAYYRKFFICRPRRSRATFRRLMTCCCVAASSFAISLSFNGNRFHNIANFSSYVDPPWSASSLESRDRKSTRLNSSHRQISYAVFCLKKKTERYPIPFTRLAKRVSKWRHDACRVQKAANKRKKLTQNGDIADFVDIRLMRTKSHQVSA